MTELTTRKWIVRKSYKGTPKRDDLEIVEETLPPRKDGGMIQTDRECAVVT